MEDNVSSEDHVSSKNRAHEEQLAFLRDRLKRNEEFFRSQRDTNSWWAVRLRIGIAALGALTPCKGSVDLAGFTPQASARPNLEVPGVKMSPLEDGF
jgi:hypothetical protein